MLNPNSVLNDVIIRKEKNLSQMRFNLPNKLNVTANPVPENYQSLPLEPEMNQSTQRSISLLKQAATAKKS